jgi:hypothetical protein
MAIYKVLSKVQKRNRFDVFGFFENTTKLTSADKEALAKQVAKDFTEQNAELVGSAPYSIVEYKMEGELLAVIIEV